MRSQSPSSNALMGVESSAKNLLTTVTRFLQRAAQISRSKTSGTNVGVSTVLAKLLQGKHRFYTLGLDYTLQDMNTVSWRPDGGVVFSVMHV